MSTQMNSADASFDICWDDIGIPHIFATTVADAFRGMGYAEGSERLWQLHLSTIVANGTAASVLGPRFVTQDLLHQAFNVSAGELPDSPGDWIVDAYLDGLNTYVLELAEIPPEFKRAGCEPREYTRRDIASRYRFTGWFQHKSWMNKIYLGKLMARNGIDFFRDHAHRFFAGDAAAIEELREALMKMDPRAGNLLFPGAVIESGSNNWAIQSELAARGAPMLAMDPHQGHVIPNTFFFSHLSAPGWDTFGASFPGVPYFMMGVNQDLTWGLTTGMVDTYDVYVEREGQCAQYKSERYQLEVAGEGVRQFDIETSVHGPLLESLTEALGITELSERQSTTALYWSMRDTPTSAGTLARLPLAKSSEEFGEFLFENGVSPLVNNIICVDRHNDLRRFIAATLPKRKGVSGSVPLAGWREDYNFEMTTGADLLAEHNPESGFSLTANNETLEDWDFPIHNFPAHHARSARIRELLSAHAGRFSSSDFEAMQRDLVDIKARESVPLIVACLTEDSSEVARARELLASWDYRAATESRAASIYYPLLDKHWPIQFMHRVLKDDLLLSIPAVAPSMSFFDIRDFVAKDSPWSRHRSTLNHVLCEIVKGIVQSLDSEFGEICTFGQLQQIQFQHSLAKYPTWEHMKVGPDPLGGSGTTLAMAGHLVTESTSEKMTVAHGPVFRWVVDLADPKHLRFVLSAGNGGNVASQFISNHYASWLKGEYKDLSLVRDELRIVQTDSIVK